MNKEESIALLEKDLKSNGISYKIKDDPANEDTQITFSIEDCELCFDGAVEVALWFDDNELTCRAYYTSVAAAICKNSDHLPEFARLLNYINYRVHPAMADPVSGRVLHLYNPRLYFTEDGNYDICYSFYLPYAFLGNITEETCSFITYCLPGLLNVLAPAIFPLLRGRISLNDSMRYIERTILGISDSGEV